MSRKIMNHCLTGLYLQSPLKIFWNKTDFSNYKFSSTILCRSKFRYSSTIFIITTQNMISHFLLFSAYLHVNLNWDTKVIDGSRLVLGVYVLQKVFFIESFLQIKVSMTDMTTWESSGEPLP